ncbi:hypothetical protein GGR57DRAFT_36577 [Xylariaceae sp. FL1272]|nr:hypothetical protein GGR57DRAFT_36577 [Xylariaceae sp. FL1272]
MSHADCGITVKGINSPYIHVLIALAASSSTISGLGSYYAIHNALKQSGQDRYDPLKLFTDGVNNRNGTTSAAAVGVPYMSVQVAKTPDLPVGTLRPLVGRKANQSQRHNSGLSSNTPAAPSCKHARRNAYSARQMNQQQGDWGFVFQLSRLQLYIKVRHSQSLVEYLIQGLAVLPLNLFHYGHSPRGESSSASVASKTVQRDSAPTLHSDSP